MIATNIINVSNAMKSFACIVLRKANVSMNVTTVINAIARTAMMRKLILFTHAVDAMLNVAKIADSTGINRNNCIVHNESRRVRLQPRV